MAKTYQKVDPELQAWMEKQRIFFVASAPSSGEGHVNCSPKGGDTFRVLNEREAAYLDLTGSGIETIAHLQENARIVIMFCAFSGPPRIVRLHGRGEVIYPKQKHFARLRAHFPEQLGVRAVIRIKLERISDSCGYAVPLFEFVGAREALHKWSLAKGDEGLAEYRRKTNRRSIDSIPGYRDDPANFPPN